MGFVPVPETIGTMAACGPKWVVLATVPVKLVPMMLSITAGCPGRI